MSGWKVAALVLALASCGEDDPVDEHLVFTDAHNYSYFGELEAAEVHLAAGQDATLSWDQLTTDMRGRAVDPASIDEISLVSLNLTIPEVLSAVASNELSQPDVLLYYLFENPSSVLDEGTFGGASWTATTDDEGRTSASLSEFSIIGNQFDPTVDFIERDGTWTWLASAWKVAEDGRKEILSSVFLIPDDESTNQAFAFTPDTATFVFEPDLRSQEHLKTTPDLDGYTLDWSEVTVDASGHEFDPLDGDRLILGHVDGAIDYVEAELVHILEVASVVYRADVYGNTDVDLMATTTLDGTTFPGFTMGEGTWLVGVECTRCTSPAPLILTVVDVVEPMVGE